MRSSIYKYHFLSVVLFSFLCLTAEENVVFCTYFTESHAKLANEWMLPSFKDDEVFLIGNGPQVCSKATFFTPGWTKTCLNKVSFIIDVMKNNPDSIVVFVDPDIIFFQSVKERLIELLQDKDFVGQLDNPQQTMCTGFFAMHANDKVLKFWNMVHDLMEDRSDLCDQKAFNHVLLTQKNPTNLKWAFLPSEEFFGGGTFKKQTWKPGRTFYIPQNPRMFHANFAFFKHKIPMLKYTQHVVLTRS